MITRWLTLMLMFQMHITNAQEGDFVIDWVDGKAQSVLFPHFQGRINIRVHGSKADILGFLDFEGEGQRFTPVAPFNNGATYEVIYAEHVFFLFTVAPPPDVSKWIISTPPAGSQKPLQIDLIKSLDKSFLQKLKITLDSTTAEGTFQFIDDITIQFIPADIWKKGNYNLRVGTNGETDEFLTRTFVVE